MCIETSNINTVCVLKEYFIHHYTLIMKTLDTIIDQQKLILMIHISEANNRPSSDKTDIF